MGRLGTAARDGPAAETNFDRATAPTCQGKLWPRGSVRIMTARGGRRTVGEGTQGWCESKHRQEVVVEGWKELRRLGGRRSERNNKRAELSLTLLLLLWEMNSLLCEHNRGKIGARAQVVSPAATTTSRSKCRGGEAIQRTKKTLGDCSKCRVGRIGRATK